MSNSLESSIAKCSNLAESRAQTEQAIREVFELALYYWDHHPAEFSELLELPEGAWVPPAVVVEAPAGVGKTQIACRIAAETVNEEKARGVNFRVLILVPYHELSNQNADFVREAGASCAIYRGRRAVDPANPEQKMCRDLYAADTAVMLGEKVTEVACGRGCLVERQCPYKAECSWWHQFDDLANVDVVLASNEFAFSPMSQEVGQFDFIIIDESFWRTDVPNRQEKLALDDFGPTALSRNPVLLRTGREDQRSTIILRGLHLKLMDACCDCNGFLTREALSGAGFCAKECEHALELEAQRKVRGLQRPNMSRSELHQAQNQGAFNMKLDCLEAVWSMARDLITGEAGPGRFGGARWRDIHS